MPSIDSIDPAILSPLLIEPTSSRRKNASALFNFVCAMAGAGLLQLPFTLKQAGWIGVIVIAVVGFMACYTAKCVLYCLYPEGFDGRRLTGYPDIGYYAYGVWGRRAVHFFHKCTLLGVCTLFLILAAKFYAESFAQHRHVDYWSRKLVLVCGAIVMIPGTLLRTMHEVSFLSIFGMSASIIAVIVCVVFSISHRVHHSDASYTTINYRLFPLAFAAITLSFAGHSTIPSIERHSSSPRSMHTVINAAYLILLGLYIPTAVFGYLAFGNDVNSPILCDFPLDNVVVIITKAIVATHCVAAYPVLMNVVFQELDDTFWAIDNFFVVRFFVRATIISITAIVAYCVPYFAPFMGLIGAACISMMVFVFPIVFSLKIRPHMLPWWEKVWGLVVMTVGVTGGSIGAYQAVKELNDLVGSHASPSG